jgi:hypothetical protein
MEQRKFEIKMDMYRLMIRCDNYFDTNSNQLVLMGFDTAGIKQAESQCRPITRRTRSWTYFVLERNLVHKSKHVCHSLHYVVVCWYIPCSWWNVLKRNRKKYCILILCKLCTQLLRKAFSSIFGIILLAHGIFQILCKMLVPTAKNILGYHKSSTGWMRLET